MAKYVFDSNIFINLQRRQPIDIFPSLWNRIGELMKDGTIISSQEVYDEIMIGGDDLEKWAKARKEYFLQSSVSVQQEVREILSSHRGLVEGGSGRSICYSIGEARKLQSRYGRGTNKKHKSAQNTRCV